MSDPSELVVVLHSRGDTRRLGRCLATCLEAGDLVLLEGPLGAGKTFLARAIARGLGVPSTVLVTSPTFDLVHELPARVPILHVDLYRLEAAGALDDLGLLERIGQDAIVLCEWGARFDGELGGEGLLVTIALDAQGLRRCTLAARGLRGRQGLSRLKDNLAHRSLHGRACPREARD